VLYTGADLIIMVLFLLIAQGWRLTDDVPPPKDQLLIGVAVLVYVVCYTIIYCVDYALRDPAAEVYVLLTPGAFFLVVIRVMLLLLCGLFFADTYRREPSLQKLTFFRRAIISCALWFLQMPMTCILAMCISRWVRHRAATVVMGTVQTAVLAYLVHCFQPERAKDYFTITVAASELEGLALEGPAVDESVAREAGGHSRVTAAETDMRATGQHGTQLGGESAPTCGGEAATERRLQYTQSDVGML